MKIHDDPILRKSLGESGFEKVREYHSVDVMADRAVEVYERVFSHR
jgi:hypothetical protein